MPQVTNKTCGRCAMTIPAAAQVCPYCRTRVLNPAAVKWVYRFGFFLFIALCVFLIIGACLPDSPDICVGTGCGPGLAIGEFGRR